MTDSNRPWWADREVVEVWVEQRHFDATLDYLGGLADTIEHRIAYGVDDPAVAASSALQALDRLWHRPRVIVETWGGEAVHIERVADDPAHVMVCRCSHPYTDHSDVGCSHCWHCASFKYSHDNERACNG
ncbi:hypothetical protein PBI_VALIDUS_59 [Mycobacterium phage Validus]|uniref:Uncharacterized protein n=1 Tax=Mycobacterium phage Validus TaxID=1414747 RepID=V5UP49_9CAUD|nr:hypothetical protein CC50_gp052 [Mycobacterium phage Validus]AHB79589.1 hypothetical protein PBI_VALIDUS_59 [Mycobacterium phage Validus]